ncbi:MAG: type II toxin-antitoxin system prevent-host-death family antitoxin [Thermodesulfobacteriota bacterium]|nr:type II toxin-antitoxin system prevent-host-death family antitoxin [Thermodesulfobacteriota bacterium]
MQTAKNKFSQMVKEAGSGEPQIVTRNGKPVVYVVDYDRYHDLFASEIPDQREVLLTRPPKEVALDLRRDPDTGRHVEL